MGVLAYRRHAQVPFPVPRQRMSHVPEGIVWSQIGRRYKTRYVNDPLYVYYSGHESLTIVHNLGNSARAFRMWNRFVLEHHLDFLKYDPVEFARHAANFCRFSLHLGESAIRQIWSLNNLEQTCRRRYCAWSRCPLGGVKFPSDRRSTKRRVHQTS